MPADPGSLRYRLREAAATGIAPAATLVADFDADGVDEQVRFVHSEGGTAYVDVAELTEGTSYTLLTIHTYGWGELCGLSDVTGDGIPEIVWYEQKGGTRRGTLTVSELRLLGAGVERRDLGVVELPYAEPASSKGGWITSVFLLGSFDLDGSGTRESLACAMVTGIGRLPRGIWLLNWETGDVVWRTPTAATPTGGRAVVDVDGDGVLEVVVGLESPDNGVTDGEWADSTAYVAAFELDGSVRWRREVGGSSSDVALATCDLDDDGAMEVVTAVSGHSKAAT